MLLSEGFESGYREPVGVVAFEPSPDTFSRLAARHQAQGWDLLGVCALQKALGNSNVKSEMIFYNLKDERVSESSTLEKRHTSQLVGRELEEVRVEVASRDAWLLDCCFLSIVVV